MRVSEVFRSVIEPTLERVAVIEVLHVEKHDGRDFVVSHRIRRNILTEFDRKLSRHLAATRGAGFPAVSVQVRIRDREVPDGWTTQEPGSHVSVPHALAAIATRALGTKNERATLRMHYHGLENDRRDTPGMKRVVEREDIETLNAALTTITQFGEIAFLDITGDFDLIMVRPPEGAELQPVIMDLFNRRLTIPPVEGLTTDSVSVPLYDFARVMQQSSEARTYMAALRHHLISRKEQAVLDFRAAAEQRIMQFDRALNGRPIEGFRMEAVVSLVSRLKAGLGPSLIGLSEDARITAFEWATAVDGGGEADGEPHPHHEALPFPSGRTPRSAGVA